MKKWKTVRVKQELIEQVEQEMQTSGYKGLSEFVSDAIRLRLQTLAKQRVAEYLERDKTISPVQSEMQRLFTPKHVWARLTPQGTVEVGITEHFQEQLKEIVNIKTDMPGMLTSRGEPFGVAESWWFTHDLYSPVDGEIVAVNTEVIDDPFILNIDPSTWIMRVNPENPESDSWTNGLLDSLRYQELIAKGRNQRRFH